jgi:hypothetical protein
MLEQRRLEQESPLLLIERMLAKLTEVVGNTGFRAYEKPLRAEDFLISKPQAPLSLDDRKRLAAVKVFEHLVTYQAQWERKNNPGA